MQQAEADEQKLPDQKFPTKNAVKEVYAKCFLADGGAAQLPNPGDNPLDNFKAYLDAAEARWAQSGADARFKKQFPDKVPEAPVARDPNRLSKEEVEALWVWRCKKFQALQEWEKYEQAGGNEAYEKLGCDKSIGADMVNVRLKELQRAKKLQAQLETLQSDGQQATPLPGKQPAPSPEPQAVAANPQHEAIFQEVLADVRKKLDSADVQQKSRAFVHLQQANKLKKEGNLVDAVLTLRNLLEEFEPELVGALAQ